ncbi:hypothetical protein ACFLUR_00325 [Chloroflexota bacterium]
MVKKAEQQLEQTNPAVDKNPQMKYIIEQLETRYEARVNKRKKEEAPQLSPEVERFLTEMERRFRES